ATARALVRKNYVDPLWAVRTYALVSIAQHDAAWAAAGASAGAADSAAFVSAAVAASSAATLARLYPHEVPRVAADLHAHLRALGERTRSGAALERAAALGDGIARTVFREREDDGAVSLASFVPPAEPGSWYSSERWPPLRPTWGEVRPFLIRETRAYAPPPPPAMGSADFEAALATVRGHTRLASARNDSIARKWADGPGTATPAGHWNEIAAGLIARHGLGEVESTRVLALMNMAMMDASIACWRTKFEHVLLRPPQADPTIVPTFPLPNFPSYPSGHAAFSGAASAVLAHRFPSEAGELTRLAEEAALSRVLSGIHYPFDSDAGLRQGRRIADVAIDLYERALPRLASGSEPPAGGRASP
ncbi:MAG TPA: vanadium-dependent haloperoxidase, partial [Longimicrobiaceae bacterium]|nr:vanadium-dependent haloperoxidase [Longimicrobiaceae bacterium]